MEFNNVKIYTVFSINNVNVIKKSTKQNGIKCPSLIEFFKKIKLNNSINGLEPGRPYGQGILSPLRLPIPPSGLIFIIHSN